jgi:hypothetical protein
VKRSGPHDGTSIRTRAHADAACCVAQHAGLSGRCRCSGVSGAEVCWWVGRLWQVFISHTSELRKDPVDRSFVAAVESAVSRAGMPWSTWRTSPPATSRRPRCAVRRWPGRMCMCWWRGFGTGHRCGIGLARDLASSWLRGRGWDPGNALCPPAHLIFARRLYRALRPPCMGLCAADQLRCAASRRSKIARPPRSSTGRLSAYRDWEQASMPLPVTGHLLH